MSGSLGAEKIGAGGESSIQILDLPKDALISAFQVLDLESLLTLARTSKALNQATQHELLWMELCRQWEHSVPLESWRARVVSGKALFRLLRSFSKLVGAWVHAHIPSNPRGSLIYITWGPDGLEGWQVNQLIQDESDLTFVKVFDVQGNPDGSHRLNFIFKEEESDNNLRREPAQLGEPSLQSDIQLHKDGSQNGLFGYEVVDPVEESSDGADTEAALVADPPLPAELQRDIVLPDVICGFEYMIRRDRPTAIRGPAHAVYPLLLSDDELLLGTQGRSQIQSEDSGSVYKRLKVAVPTSEQDLAGLWTGCYDDHGWEILNLTYTSDGSIIGTKVTGDPNVPSGVISFKTNLSMQLESASDDLGISVDDNDMTEWTRYPGQGRVAGEVFQNPSWVDGVFLVGLNRNICFEWIGFGPTQYKPISLEAAFKEWSKKRHLRSPSTRAMHQ